jgi:hypothetical protein
MSNSSQNGALSNGDGHEDRRNTTGLNDQAATPGDAPFGIEQSSQAATAREAPFGVGQSERLRDSAAITPGRLSTIPETLEPFEEQTSLVDEQSVVLEHPALTIRITNGIHESSSDYDSLADEQGTASNSQGQSEERAANPSVVLSLLQDEILPVPPTAGQSGLHPGPSVLRRLTVGGDLRPNRTSSRVAWNFGGSVMLFREQDVPNAINPENALTHTGGHIQSSMLFDSNGEVREIREDTSQRGLTAFEEARRQHDAHTWNSDQPTGGGANDSLLAPSGTACGSSSQNALNAPNATTAQELHVTFSSDLPAPSPLAGANTACGTTTSGTAPAEDADDDPGRTSYAEHSWRWIFRNMVHVRHLLPCCAPAAAQPESDDEELPTRPSDSVTGDMNSTGRNESDSTLPARGEDPLPSGPSSSFTVDTAPPNPPLSAVARVKRPAGSESENTSSGSATAPTTSQVQSTSESSNSNQNAQPAQQVPGSSDAGETGHPNPPLSAVVRGKRPVDSEDVNTSSGPSTAPTTSQVQSTSESSNSAPSAEPAQQVPSSSDTRDAAAPTLDEVVAATKNQNTTAFTLRQEATDDKGRFLHEHLASLRDRIDRLLSTPFENDDGQVEAPETDETEAKTSSAGNRYRRAGQSFRK